MIEYSVSLPRDSTASFSVSHGPDGTCCVIESENARYDVSYREYGPEENE